jgi:hypothetical protein
VEELLSVLFEVFFEWIVQLLFELGFRLLAEAFRKGPDRHPGAAFLGYMMLGSAAGGLSVWVFPRSFIRRESLRMLNVLATPLLAGLVMSALGAYERKAGKRPLRLDSFTYGFAFALAMALVRLRFTSP